MGRPQHRSRRIQVFTCDRGRRWLDVDRAPEQEVRGVLQEIVESGFWRELEKFPVDAIARFLPGLVIPPHTRRLLEIWVEERGPRTRAA